MKSEASALAQTIVLHNSHKLLAKILMEELAPPYLYQLH